jgi:hypothetical protein
MILPKPHISWSQINCWMTNPSRFRKEYFENSDKLDSRYLRFGKGFARIMEMLAKDPSLLEDKLWVTDNFGLDINSPEFFDFKSNLRWYDTPEYEIRCDIAGVPVLAYIDSYNTKDNVFLEFKTGTQPWDRAKVQKHDQLTLYATALKWKTGKMPEYCDLDWIQTKESNIGPVNDFWRDNEKKINVTGLIKQFHREFDERELESR